MTEATDDPIWAYNYCPTPYSWTVLLGLILYLAFFAPGLKIPPLFSYKRKDVVTFNPVFFPVQLYGKSIINII